MAECIKRRARDYSTWSFMKRAFGVLFLFLCLPCHQGWAAGPRPRASLTDAVLMAAFPLSEVDSAAYDGPARACIDRYLVDAGPFLRDDRRTDNPEKAIASRRWRLERHMKMIFGPQAEQDARSFAGAVPLGFEWEGMSEGPLREAEYAEMWLERHPRSLLGPFLHLFAAHRCRAGFEAAGREKAGGSLPMAARNYRVHLRAARSAGNKKINCIADDMEALPYVYLPGFGRP